MRVKYTQAARKHRIGRTHVAYVIATYAPVAEVTRRGEAAYRWTGNDATGRELDVIGVPKTDDKTGEPILLITHVFPTALKG